MKTLFKWLVGLVVALALAGGSAFATGAVGLNPVQTGNLTFTVGTGVYITNQFSFPYTTVPILQTSLITTNAFPVTNVFVTTTNFAVSANTTNSQISWVAFVGYPRVQTGTNAIQGALLVTNTFVTPFAFNPVVQLTGSITNGLQGVICVSSVSPTNFVVTFGNTNQAIYWTATGVSAVPGSYNPNSPSITF